MTTNDHTRAAESTVTVPGAMFAHYRDGRIVRWVFLPAAGDAGYFGPAARLYDGDEDLDITTDGSPFWQAVAADLGADGTCTVEWES